MKEEIRRILNIPKEQRIGQYIYNLFRDREVGRGVAYDEPHGVDIFDVSDREFVNRIEKGL